MALQEQDVKLSQAHGAWKEQGRNYSVSLRLPGVHGLRFSLPPLPASLQARLLCSYEASLLPRDGAAVLI